MCYGIGYEGIPMRTSICMYVCMLWVVKYVMVGILYTPLEGKEGL